MGTDQPDVHRVAGRLARAWGEFEEERGRITAGVTTPDGDGLTVWTDAGAELDVRMSSPHADAHLVVADAEEAGP